MGILVNYLQKRAEKRAGSLNVSDKNHWLLQALGGGIGTAAGVNVTPETALKTSAVF